MKKLLFTCVLLLATLTAAAQFRYRYTTYEQQKEQQKQAIRDQINLDFPYLIQISYLLENQRGLKREAILPQHFHNNLLVGDYIGYQPSDISHCYL